MANDKSSVSAQAARWRDVLPVHPAADNSVIFEQLPADVDPYAFVISTNIHRRHLTNEQKDELLKKLIKATPHLSNRQIGRKVGFSHPHVAKVRSELEKSGDVETVTTSTDTLGRQQPVWRHAEADEQHKPGNVSGVAMHPYAERGLDLYETPPEAVRALLRVESFRGPIWEPACGPGGIVRELRAAGHRVVATDLKDYGCPDSRGDVDFLTEQRAPDDVQMIITNPPYMHAAEFVRRSLTFVQHVVMLMRLAFLESEGRSDILDDGRLVRVYPFKKRLPMMHRDGWGGPIASNSIPFAWFVWDANHCGPWTGQRISWEPAIPAAATPSDDGLDIPDFLLRRRAP